MLIHQAKLLLGRDGLTTSALRALSLVYLGSLPFVSNHEKDIVVDNGVQALSEEVFEVFKVLDADALQ